MLEYILKSEIIIVFLFICSVIVFSLSLERYFFLRSFKRKNMLFFSEYFNNPSIDLLKRYFFLKEFHTLLTINLSTKEKMEIVHFEISHQKSKLQKKITIIGIISNISPLLGILGTVIGIIQSLKGLENEKINLINQGIWTSLITTAIGLIIAIPSLLIYYHLNFKLDEIIFEISSNLKKILLKEESLLKK